ncbi:unnamed protein product [Protopolystoma xenopodis]|uniref:Uncharacterized protein n=1 Tax=Protopolystoma xenopodis TaxID=117903 RepID=A0A3S5BG09_9PLAT|nr:unnamed protein product [Protopolystoma xenopodis]
MTTALIQCGSHKQADASVRLVQMTTAIVTRLHRLSFFGTFSRIRLLSHPPSRRHSPAHRRMRSCKACQVVDSTLHRRNCGLNLRQTD